LKERYILCCLYITPNPTTLQLTELEIVFKHIDNNYSEYKVIYSGDLNMNFRNSSNSMIRKLKITLESLKLSQLVTEPTYPTHPKYSRNPAILDLIITNDKKLFEKVIIRENIAESCDHFSLLTSIIVSNENPKKESKIKYIIDLNDQNIDDFNRNMSLIDWDNLTEYSVSMQFMRKLK
jgi:hypothetical protein